jgi:phosphoribosyl 1,2-cyclic phosphodiesterase
MPSFAICLQSGSAGNALFVEAGGVRLLFDAGISGRRIEERLLASGIETRTVHAVVVSHEHTDHVTGLGVIERRYGLPVHATAGTLGALSPRTRLRAVARVCAFHAGEILRFGRVSVETYGTPHDAADSVCFVIDDGHRRLGILTDIGHVSDQLRAVVATLDAVYMESNHDPEMLRTGAYPAMLKRRIAGPEGHLSNDESAVLLRDHGTRLAWAVLSHLSGDNNTPQAALATHRRLGNTRIHLHTASRADRGPTLAFG